MQFSTTIIALAAAMGVSAGTSTVFKVSDFAASGIPHSSEVSYSFTVIQPGTMETTGVKCSKLLPSNGALPAVTDGTCKDSSRKWTIEKSGDDLILTVSQQVTPSSTQDGSYTIPASDLEYKTADASSYQAYTGPTSFDLTESSYSS
ncbi:hypothetical protein SLS53_008617 [Cytospora paraplurivora]|uniref:AA1-like domain-containing protein n=1 Tax=Cytospora paraplurivora TaxID=2898453 RepID=A0AAN9YBZ1_9PEZI